MRRRRDRRGTVTANECTKCECGASYGAVIGVCNYDPVIPRPPASARYQVQGCNCTHPAEHRRKRCTSDSGSDGGQPEPEGKKVDHARADDASPAPLQGARVSAFMDQ